MTNEHACPLTDHLREQARCHAGDTGNVRQRIEWVAATEIERLRAIVGRLPKTADGVPVVPSMALYGKYGGEEVVGAVCFGSEAFAVAEASDADDHDDPMPHGYLHIINDGGSLVLPILYSTREAAEAALRAAKGEA